MTEIGRKTTKAECLTILQDANSSSELKEKAQKRLDEIIAWQNSQKGKETSSGKGFTPRTPDRGQINIEQITIDGDRLKAIEDETKIILNEQLARIYYIEQELKKRGITPTGPFVGMLYNQQMEALRASL